MQSKKRCAWVGTDPLMIHYHDSEWGRPLHQDRKIFEYLVLDGAQAGLSWSTILKKRENYRQAFDNFNPHKIARYKKAKIKKLLANSGIIRNKLKINSAIINARVFLKVQKEFGTFDKYIWQFTGHKVIRNKFKSINQIPAQSQESRVMSKDLIKRGFKFVGPTICYAFMQAMGMVNDHTRDCWCYKK